MAFNKSDIVISIIDPSGFPFQLSPLCVSPLLSASSIPALNRCSRCFGASISLICHTHICSCSVWTGFLLEHHRMCRIVSSSLSPQRLHIADTHSSNLFALSSVYHCWAYCFEKCALVIDPFPNFLALLAVISSSISVIQSSAILQLRIPSSCCYCLWYGTSQVA